MAVQRFTNGLKKYATIELNHATWPKDARVFAQLPLDPAVYKKNGGVPAENGFWFVYDELNEMCRVPLTTTEPIVIMYNAEKEYNKFEVGMNQWCLYADPEDGSLTEHEYPRCGAPATGDTYTTNALCYDTADFSDDAALVAALGAVKTAPLYLIPGVGGTGAPQVVTASKIATAGTVAQITKLYTMPNGEPGVHVKFIKVV